MRICQQDGCSIEIDSNAHPAVKYCPEHSRVRAAKPEKDKAPASARVPKGRTRDLTASSAATALGFQIGRVGALVATVDPWCGEAILRGVPDLITQLDACASSSPAFAKTLKDISEKGSYVGLIGVILGMLAPIAIHHVPIPALKKRREAMTPETMRMAQQFMQAPQEGSETTHDDFSTAPTVTNPFASPSAV